MIGELNWERATFFVTRKPAGRVYIFNCVSAYTQGLIKSLNTK